MLGSASTTLLGSVARLMGAMPHHDTREYLARNLRHLMALKGWSQVDMAKASGVSQRAISNILNKNGFARIDTVLSLGRAFGLNEWHMLMKNLPQDLARCESIGKLVDHYLDADEKAQEYISGVAEREAKYKGTKK